MFKVTELHNQAGMISKPAQKPLSPILFFKITFNFFNRRKEIGIKSPEGETNSLLMTIFERGIWHFVKRLR